MPKLKLSLDHLSVESFETSDAAPVLGTVRGQAGAYAEAERQPLEPDLTTNHPSMWMSCPTQCTCGTGVCITCGNTCNTAPTCISCQASCITCETCQPTTCIMTWPDNCCA